MHSDAQRRAKRNIQGTKSASPYSLPGFGFKDISFTRPSVSKGYGAILTYLDSLGPAKKAKINACLQVKPTYLSTTYNRLIHAGLITHCAKGYKITRLGRAYVNQWLGADIY